MPVLENVRIAHDTYRLRLGDATMARTIKPGQFVMIRPGPEGATNPLLGRPLALYDVVRDSAGTPTAFEVVYLVVGRGTAALVSPAGRAAVGLGAAWQWFWSATARTGPFCSRRYWADPVPGPGTLVARSGTVWRCDTRNDDGAGRASLGHLGHLALWGADGRVIGGSR